MCVRGLIFTVVIFFAVGVFIHIPFDTNLEIIISDTINSVVHISNNDCGWQGSGVLIAPDLILTARHVVKEGKFFTVSFQNQSQSGIMKVMSSKKYDLGFIKLSIPIVDIKPARLGSIEDCRLGQQIFAIGSPYGKENFNSVTLGIISGLDRDWDFTDPYTGENYGWSVSFTTDAAGHSGNSGCPVFTMDGKVRGILVGGYSPVLIGCIPVDLVIGDIDIIRMMFAQDKYKFEVRPEPVYDSYGPYEEY